MAFSALIGALRVALRLDQAEYVEGLKQSKSELKKAAIELNRVARDMNASGRQLTLGVSVPLAAAAAASVKMAADFESSMIKVKISTQATASEIGLLEAEARKIGKATVFSAGEAADAMDMLAKTGLSATQILSGAASAAVNLAAAAGSELEPAASAISDAMQQFGINAAQLPGVVNQITGAVNESKLSFEDFTQASGQAGGVAASLGVSFEDFNTVLAGTSSLFSSGSDAGTSFKTFLTTLVPKSNEAAAAIEQFGLKFFNADGSLRSMAQIAEELRTKLAGLSDEAKNQVLKDIFGTDAMRTAIGLMKQGADGLDRIAKSIAATDAAAQAAERMKGFNGQLEQLKGSIEELAIAIGKTGVLAGATALVQGLTGVIDKVTELDPLIVKLGLGTAAAFAAVGPLNLALGGLAGAAATSLRAITNLASGATTLKVAMTGLGAFLGPGGLMILGIGALAAVTIVAVKRFQELRGASAETTQQTKALSSVTDAYVTALNAAAAASGEARKKFLEEAAAKRQSYIDTRNDTAAKLANAKATLAQAEADLAKRVNETNPFLVNAEDPNSGLVAQDNRTARAAANVTAQRNALAAANKKVADAEAQLAASSQAAAAPAKALSVNLDKVATSAGKAKSEAEDLAEALRRELAAAQREVAEAGISQNEQRARELLIKSHEAYLLGLKAEAKAFGDLAEIYRIGDIEFQKVADSQGELTNTSADLAAAMDPLKRDFDDLIDDAAILARGFDDITFAFDDLKRAFKSGDFSRVLADVFQLVKSLPQLLAAPGGLATAGSAVANAIGGRAGRAIGGGLGIAGTALGASAGLVTAASMGALGSGLAAGLAIQFAPLLGPIGIAAGAAYALVKLLSGRPSNKGAGIDLATGALSGKSRSPETEEAARAAADAIKSGQSILEAAGIKLGATVHGLVIGTRDLTQVYLTNGRTVTSAVGDAAAAAEAGLKAMLETATFTDETQRKLVQSMLAAGKGFDEIAAKLDSLTQARALRQGIEDEILKLTDPEAFNLKELERNQEARRKEIEAAFSAGLLSDEEIGDLRLALDKLEGLELADVLGEAGDALEDLAARQRDLTREYYDAIGETGEALRLLREEQLAETPEALRGQLQALFDVQDAVAARDAADERAAKAREDAARAAEVETRRLEGVRDRFQALAEGIAAVRKELSGGALGAVGIGTRAAVTARELAQLQARAGRGDEAALAALPDAIRNFVDAQGAVAGSRSALNAQLQVARRAAAVGERAAQGQVSDAQRQLAQLQAQTAHLGEVRDATLGVQASIDAAANANFEQQSAQSALLQSMDRYLAALGGQLESFASSIGDAIAKAPAPNLAPFDATAIAAAVGPAANDVHTNDNGTPAEQFAEAFGEAIAPMAAATIKTAGMIDDVTQGGTAFRTTTVVEP